MSELRGSALVCSADARLQAAVTEAGFVASVAATCAAALPRLRHEEFTLVVADDTTGRDTASYLQGLAGARRRNVFVLLVSPGVETGDRLAAWSASADLAVEPGDLGHLRRLVGDGLREKREFYRRFEELRREAGGRLGAHA